MRCVDPFVSSQLVQHSIRNYSAKCDRWDASFRLLATPPPPCKNTQNSRIFVNKNILMYVLNKNVFWIVKCKQRQHAHATSISRTLAESRILCKKQRKLWVLREPMRLGVCNMVLYCSRDEQTLFMMVHIDMMSSIIFIYNMLHVCIIQYYKYVYIYVLHVL